MTAKCTVLPIGAPPDLADLLEEGRQYTDQHMRYLCELIKRECADPGGKRNRYEAVLAAGYKEKSVYRTVTRLKQTPHLENVYQRYVQRELLAMGVEAKHMLKFGLDMLYADTRDIFNEDGSVKQIREMPKVFRRGLISKIKVGTTKREVIKNDDGEVEETVENYVTEVAFESRQKWYEFVANNTMVQALARPQDQDREETKVQPAEVDIPALARQISFVFNMSQHNHYNEQLPNTEVIDVKDDS